jgi:hypothetical protein
MTGQPKVENRALLAAAMELDARWDAYVTSENDAGFDEVVQAIDSLRRVLAGTRRLRFSSDQYGFTRTRCECGWVGSPWDGSHIGDGGRQMSPRQQAAAEFALHVCYEQEG